MKKTEEQKPQILVASSAVDFYRSYSMNCRVSFIPNCGSFDVIAIVRLGQHHDEQTLEEIGPVGSIIAVGAGKITGLEYLLIASENITAIKKEGEEWVDIEPQLLDLFAEAYNKTHESAFILGDFDICETISDIPKEREQEWAALYLSG